MNLPVMDSLRSKGASCASDCASARRHHYTSRPGITHRSFLRRSTVATGAVAAIAASLSPLRELTDTDEFSVAKFLQKHYKEMDAQEMAAALQRIADDVEKRYELRPDIRDIKPMDGVEFVYALNLSRCIGCRKCVHACVAENNQSRSPEVQYIRVLEMPRGTTDIEQGNHHYDRATVPSEDHYYMPIQCHQCANPPCVKVCPVEATWQEVRRHHGDRLRLVHRVPLLRGGVSLLGPPIQFSPSRRFPRTGSTPTMAYLSNRPRSKGVMEKCHVLPAPHPRGQDAGLSGGLPDRGSQVRECARPRELRGLARSCETKRVFVLKAEVGTLPRFFYYFDERDPINEKVPTGDES